MMNKVTLLILIILSFTFNFVQAGELKIIEQDDGSVKIIEKSQPQSLMNNTNKLTYKQAKQMVKNLTYSNQKTIEDYFHEKVSVPAVEDYGWASYPLESGGFEIEKHIVIDNDLDTVYRWRVSPNGKIEPMNGHAISITKQK